MWCGGGVGPAAGVPLVAEAFKKNPKKLKKKQKKLKKIGVLAGAAAGWGLRRAYRWSLRRRRLRAAFICMTARMDKAGAFPFLLFYFTWYG